MTDWQPIATAPRDGTVIIVYDADEDGWGVCRASFQDDDWYPIVVNHEEFPSEYVSNPTHWMPDTPLPPPPEATDG